MANVSNQVEKHEDYSKDFESLAEPDNFGDDYALELNDGWEALPDEELSYEELPDLDSETEFLSDIQKDLEALLPESFSPDFRNPPTGNYWRGRDTELESLNLALETNALVSVVDKVGGSGLAARYFQADQHPHKFWIDTNIYRFTDFAQWAIAYFRDQAGNEPQDQVIPDESLTSTLIEEINAHSCLITIAELDQNSDQQEFWLDFLEAWQIDRSSKNNQNSKILAPSGGALEFPFLVDSIELSEPLSPAESADLFIEIGILGDRQDLETLGKLLGGNPLSLTLAANLLIAEEQIPQIRYLVRYGKIFDLNQPQRFQPIPSQAVFDRSFKRLLPKLRNLLIIASIYAQPFNVRDLQGMQEQTGDEYLADLVDLQKLEKFGLIRSLGQNYFCCDRQIKALIPLPDPKPLHEQAIKYFWTQTKPYFDWESDQDLAPYLAIFHHCCALGEFYRAFYIIRDDSEQCLDPYLEAQGKHLLRISLFKPLLAAWQGIQSERSEFGAVLMGLGDSYSALHRYDQAVPLYQEWLRILVKRHDPLERQAKAQCLYKLAITLFTQASVPPLSILPYFQESLEIAIKSSDRPLELNNLLGLGNLYSRIKEYPQALEYYDRHLNLAREVQNLEAQIDCLPMMATAYQAIKQYDKALELYRTHLTLIPDYGFDQAARADSLENVAQIYQILGDYPQAKVSYQDCLDLVITNGIENASQRGKCLFGIGISSDRLGQFKEAITYYQQALEIFNNTDQEPDCLINLANAHTSLGQYKEAVGFYEQALKLSLGSNNISWQAQALIGLGNVQNSLGKFVKAIQFYEQAWEISKNLKAQKAIALGSLGHVYNAIGQYQEAMDLYKRSLAIAKEVGDKSQQALCLNSLGQVLDRLGYYAQALQFYQEWIDLKKAMGDRTATLTTLNRNRSSNLAGNLAHTKYAQAIEFHQQWIEVKRKMGDRQGEANSLGNLGNAFFALGQYPQAIQAYQQCLEMARTISDRRSEASSLSGLGSAFFVLGQYTQAIEFHSRSLEISQKIDDPIIQAQTFSNLGKAYYALGQYLQAAQKYQQCLEIIRKIGNRQGEANVLGDLGNVHYALGKYSQANDFYLQWLEISTEIGDRSQEGNALGGLGNGHNAIGQYPKAVEFYSQWLEIAQEISDRRSQANALAGLGNAYNALGEYSRAIEFHQQSLKIQKENSDRHTEKNNWYNFADTLEHLEQKSLSPNPYTAIDVESIDQDDSAIQQLLEAGSKAILPREIKSNITKKSPILKSHPTLPKLQTNQNWLGSTLGWLTGKK